MIVQTAFYGKALVVDSELLYSYNTLIINIADISVQKDIELLTKTTLRHLKEFLKQNNLKADTKKQIAKDYNFN